MDEMFKLGRIERLMLITAVVVLLLDTLATFHVFPRRSLSSMVAGALITTGSRLDVLLSLWYLACLAIGRVPLAIRSLVVLMTSIFAGVPAARDFLRF
jgi:hypothetical protein